MFTETGTVTSTLVFQGGPLFAYGNVVTWTASFTIDSPNGTVSGTKTLRQSFVANCLGQGLSGGLIRSSHQAVATLDYEATIRTADGRFRDQGQANGYVSRDTCADGQFLTCGSIASDGRLFLENFLLSTGVIPVDTSGKATGGGQLISGSNPLERVTFGFNVSKNQDETRLQGTCAVVDHATGTQVKCLTVTDYQQIGNTATWEGTANVNGVAEHYRITAQDNGEPNQGVDTFSIKTDSYEAAGNVQYGNVKIHKQTLVP